MATNPRPARSNLVWATDTVNDTVSGQPNVSVPSATMKSDGFSSDQYPPMNWFNYWMNGVGQYVQGTTRSSTYVIASSDSTAQSQACADVIIPVASDAAVAIETALSAFTFGELKIMEGTYYFDTTLDLGATASNTIISGCGAGTMLTRRAATFANMITVDTTACTYLTLRDFVVDGDEVRPITAITASVGIGFTGGAGETIKLDNVGVKSVWSSDNASGDAYAFSYCKNLTNCYASNIYSEKEDCRGYFTCTNLLNCIAEDIVADASTGDDAFGFQDCTSLITCIAQDNAGHDVAGFQTCVGVIGCNSINNVGTNTGYGYRASTKMQQNTGSGNTPSGTYDDTTCSATATYNATYKVADTANGGFNSFT